jgi:hypothetical protein
MYFLLSRRSDNLGLKIWLKMPITGEFCTDEMRKLCGVSYPFAMVEGCLNRQNIVRWLILIFKLKVTK